jgi:hypothetical protein
MRTSVSSSGAVELRLGQRVGALHLDRVLRCEHEEGRFQPMTRARDGDAELLHGLEQGALCLRRRAVDLIRQDDVSEDGTGLELETLAPVLLFHDHVGAGDVGRHQVGRELNAAVAQPEAAGERPHEQGLAEARRALEEHVTLGDQADEDLVDHALLADDRDGDRCLEALDGACERLQLLGNLHLAQFSTDRRPDGWNQA